MESDKEISSNSKNNGYSCSSIENSNVSKNREDTKKVKLNITKKSSEPESKTKRITLNSQSFLKKRESYKQKIDDKKYPFDINREINKKFDKTKSSMPKIKHEEKWDSFINNPNYYFDRKNKNLRKLIYKGVPESHRAFLWPFLLRKNLIMGFDQKIEELLISKRGESMFSDQIKKDVDRTYNFLPTNEILSSGSSQMLFNILEDYSLIDQEIGYTQGLNEVASFFLRHMSHKNARMCFVSFNLGSKHFLRGLYLDNFPLLKYLNYFLILQLKARIPRLWRHLNKIEYDITINSTRWFLCLFVQSLPFPLLVRVWDAIIFEGPHVIICTTIVLLAYHKKDLLKMDIEHVATFFQNSMRTYVYKIDKVMKEIKKISSDFIKNGTMNNINCGVFRVGNTSRKSLFSPACGLSNINILTSQSSNLRTSVFETIVKKAENTYHKKESEYTLSKMLFDVKFIDQNSCVDQSLHRKLILPTSKESSDSIASGSQSDSENGTSYSNASSLFSDDAFSSEQSSFVINDATSFSASRSHSNRTRF